MTPSHNLKTEEILKPNDFLFLERGNTLIRAENLSKRFETGTYALRNINLEIFENESLFLIGPSGSGKTTLLRVLFGLDNTYEGNVRSMILPTEKIAFLSQTADKIIENLTFLENIKIAGDHRKLFQKWNSIVSIFRLDPYLRFRVDSLSRGIRQKMELALTLLMAERIVVIDEALTNISSKETQNLFREIKRYTKEAKITLIQTTHVHKIAFNCADRIVVLVDGEIQCQGTPMSIFLEPPNLKTFRLIGRETTEKNYLHGRIRKTSGSVIFKKRSIEIPLDSFSFLSSHPFKNNTRCVLAFSSNSPRIVDPKTTVHDFQGQIRKISYTIEEAKRIFVEICHELIVIDVHHDVSSDLYEIGNDVGIILNERFTYFFDE